MGLFRQEDATERQVQAMIDLQSLPGYPIDRFSLFLSESVNGPTLPLPNHQMISEWDLFFQTQLQSGMKMLSKGWTYLEDFCGDGRYTCHTV